MRPEELMLGDLVKFTDNDGSCYLCKVAGLNDRNEVFLTGDEGLELDLFGDDLESVEPIEITKGFLLKNGFIELDNRYEPNWYLMDVDVDERNRPCGIVRVALFDDCTLVKAVRYKRQYTIAIHRPFAPYIHQLQQVCRMCNIEIDWKL